MRGGRAAERVIYAGLVGDMRAGLDRLLRDHPEAAKAYLDAIREHREVWGRGKPEPSVETLLREYDERLDAELQELTDEGSEAA